MKPITRIIPVLLLCFCSCKQKNSNETTVTDTVLQSSTIPASIDYGLTSLKDTTVNGILLKFQELNKKKNDSLVSFAIETKIKLGKFDHLVSRIKKCLVIKLANGTDSLCNIRDAGGYFEEYEIKGLWEEKGQLLATFRIGKAMEII